LGRRGYAAVIGDAQKKFSCLMFIEVVSKDYNGLIIPGAENDTST